MPCFIRILGSDRMSDDVTISIKAEIIRSIKYEFVANLCLGESQQLIDIQLILSGLRTGLYDRKALMPCFIRILGSDRMSDDIAFLVKGKILSHQQTTKKLLHLLEGYRTFCCIIDIPADILFQDGSFSVQLLRHVSHTSLQLLTFI